MLAGRSQWPSAPVFFLIFLTLELIGVELDSKDYRAFLSTL